MKYLSSLTLEQVYITAASHLPEAAEPEIVFSIMPLGTGNIFLQTHFRKTSHTISSSTSSRSLKHLQNEPTLRRPLHLHIFIINSINLPQLLPGLFIPTSEWVHSSTFARVTKLPVSTTVQAADIPISSDHPISTYLVLSYPTLSCQHSCLRNERTIHKPKLPTYLVTKPSY